MEETLTVQRGAARRVAAVHRQVRVTLAFAAAFALVAPVAAAAAGDDARWLGLHVLLVGGLLTAISGATQMLAVTWSAGPAPTDRAAAVQRGLIVVGAAALVAARHLDAPTWVVGAAGTAVVGALALLARLLVRIRAGAATERFHPAIESYVMAIGFGIAGSAVGIAMATGAVAPGAARDAHLTINLFGLVGLVVAATLPYFVATQVRMRQSRRATPIAVRTVVGALALAALVATAGHLAERPGVAAAGLATYAVAIVAIVVLLPVPGRKQFAWAGPRLVQLAAGIGWWIATTGVLALHHLGRAPDEGRILVALAAGGYAQIFVASLAYFAPVVRGGGHVRLAAGFTATRSWTSVLAANGAAVAAIIGSRGGLAVGLGVWVLAAAAGAVRFASSTSSPRNA